LEKGDQKKQKKKVRKKRKTARFSNNRLCNQWNIPSLALRGV
jgi:hypothetical protein